MVNLGPAARDRLETYIEMLAKWRRITNLISDSSFANVWQRHVADCWQLPNFCPDARYWLDMGSGAGFPGLIVAIRLADSHRTEVHCVESDGRKCAFLRDVARRLRLPAIIHNKRVEALNRNDLPTIDAITARAFAPISKIVGLSRQYIAEGAIAILHRGRSAMRELEGLDLSHYTIETTPNMIDPIGTILCIRKHV